MKYLCLLCALLFNHAINSASGPLSEIPLTDFLAHVTLLLPALVHQIRLELLPGDPKLRTLLIIAAVLLVPIVPFVLLGSFLEPMIESWLGQPHLKAKPLAASAVVVVLLACDILLPVPSSLVGTFAGQFLGTVVGSFATWMGLNLSCLIGYWLAATIGTPLVKRLSDKNAIREVESLTATWGIWALIGLRPIPVLAEASVLLAGLGHMPQRRFWPAVIGANLGLAIAYAALGSYSAEHGWLGLALAISLAIPLALFCGWFFARKSQTASSEGD